MALVCRGGGGGGPGSRPEPACDSFPPGRARTLRRAGTRVLRGARRCSGGKRRRRGRARWVPTLIRSSGLGSGLEAAVKDLAAGSRSPHAPSARRPPAGPRGSGVRAAAAPGRGAGAGREGEGGKEAPGLAGAGGCGGSFWFFISSGTQCLSLAPPAFEKHLDIWKQMDVFFIKLSVPCLCVWAFSFYCFGSWQVFVNYTPLL